MKNKKTTKTIEQFFGRQHRTNVWDVNDIVWGKAIVEHFQRSMMDTTTMDNLNNNNTLPRSYPMSSSSSSSIPRILHFVWLGPYPIPQRNEVLIETWRRHHDDWEFHIWRNDNIQQLHQLYNAQAFQYTMNNGHYGMASDILRLEILFTYGGVYVDVDYICVQSLSTLPPLYSCNETNVDFYCGASHVGCIEINNGLLASKVRSPIVMSAMNDIRTWFTHHGRPLTLVSQFLGHVGDNNDDSMTTTTTSSLLTHMDICRHTGPGLWTRIVGQQVVLQLQKQQQQQQSYSSLLVPSDDDDNENERIVIFPFHVFHPMFNSDRQLERTNDEIIQRYAISGTTIAIHLWHCSWQQKQQQTTTHGQLTFTTMTNNNNNVGQRQDDEDEDMENMME